MEKIRIKSISKSEFRSCYHFEKVQYFFEFMRNFLIDLGFDSNHIKFYGLEFSEKEGEYSLDREESIGDYVDKLDNFKNETYSVDIIAFSDRMITIINSKEDKQQEIVEKLEKYVVC
jgi:hypothetical protein